MVRYTGAALGSLRDPMPPAARWPGELAARDRPRGPTRSTAADCWHRPGLAEGRRRQGWPGRRRSWPGLHLQMVEQQVAEICSITSQVRAVRRSARLLGLAAFEEPAAPDVLIRSRTGRADLAAISGIACHLAAIDVRRRSAALCRSSMARPKSQGRGRDCRRRWSTEARSIGAALRARAPRQADLRLDRSPCLAANGDRAVLRCGRGYPAARADPAWPAGSPAAAVWRVARRTRPDLAARHSPSLGLGNSLEATQPLLEIAPDLLLGDQLVEQLAQSAVWDAVLGSVWPVDGCSCPGNELGVARALAAEIGRAVDHQTPHNAVQRPWRAGCP